LTGNVHNKIILNYPATSETRQNRTTLETSRANLPNRYSALWQRPVTHAQTWASYSALYRFGRLSTSSCYLTRWYSKQQWTFRFYSAYTKMFYQMTTNLYGHHSSWTTWVSQ